ncbi:MAG: hypothetical protein VR65_23905 [Desulfobulbaceae bacterium BRH_c16a]|nr:MAG: hypothetical protein VR65_23905 [Desulfobulbaceae bacterium BRH_c16a]
MKTSSKTLNNEKGATIVFVAIILGVLMMFAALTIDVGHLYGVRNELQDAADAGALAGASVLFDSDSTLNRDAALAEGHRIALANKTGNQFVVEKTVETGHWSFSSKTFTANDTTEQAPWHGRSMAQLDIDNNFINAVRVQTDRSNAPSFFARIFGYDEFLVSTDAVAYIGFAGTINPEEIDRPIAICRDAIVKNDALDFKDAELDCNMGRMLNSGGNANTSMTAMWTNYTQDPCSTASSSSMNALTEDCSTGNPTTLNYGEGIGSQNGVQDNILDNIVDCWIAAADSDNDDIPDTLWPLLLPVVECGVSNTCAPLVGAVQIDVVWIIHQNDPQMNDVPLKMDDWECSTTPATQDERFTCWKEFVDHFDLQNVTGAPATDADYEEMYQKKNLFFLPSCDLHEPTGHTGGENFGVLAEIPVLVE